MVQNASILRASRSGLMVFTVALVLGGGWWLAPAGQSQQIPAATTNTAAVNALLAKLKTQQDQAAANQTKIEAQTAQLKEELRQARIYSVRTGSGHR